MRPGCDPGRFARTGAERSPGFRSSPGPGLIVQARPWVVYHAGFLPAGIDGSHLLACLAAEPCAADRVSVANDWKPLLARRRWLCRPSDDQSRLRREPITAPQSEYSLGWREPETRDRSDDRGAQDRVRAVQRARQGLSDRIDEDTTPETPAAKYRRCDRSHGPRCDFARRPSPFASEPRPQSSTFTRRFQTVKQTTCQRPVLLTVLPN